MIGFCLQLFNVAIEINNISPFWCYTVSISINWFIGINEIGFILRQRLIMTNEGRWYLFFYKLPFITITHVSVPIGGVKILMSYEKVLYIENRFWNTIGSTVFCISELTERDDDDEFLSK